MLTKLTCSILAGLCLTPLALADADSDRAVAEAYLAAYESQDYETMRTLYADDAVFVDPTSFHLSSMPPIEWQGPETIIAGIASWGLAHIDYHPERSFTASGAVVFEGDADVYYTTPGGDRVFNYPIVTIITISDGRVVEHRDYTDYAGSRELTPLADASTSTN
tara:strand:- start:50993 stop:51484 length:492 start_codon:yes stop_codon:yes gene_type:complete